MRLASVSILVVCANLGALGTALGDDIQELVKVKHARICDTSGCYLAWKVVDSDHDGVADADELMAGTDPYDPLSRPSLQVVAELGGKKQLPSFEAGLGAYIVFPPELQVMMAEGKGAPLAAFPLAGERYDTLTRLGISADTLTQYGIDPQRDGFTVGLSLPVKDQALERRVGGIELRLISNDDDPAPLDPNCGKHGAEVANDLYEDGLVTTYEDGARRIAWSDGSGTMLDKDGNVVGTWYVNPDADPEATAPTPEQEASFKRLRGTTILTVDGWTTPDGGAIPEDKRNTVILVDPEQTYNTGLAFDAPRLTSAQPEARPDLPNPGLPADPGGITGACSTGC